AAFFSDFRNCTVRVSSVNTHDSSGAAVFETYSPSPSTYVFEHNDIRMSSVGEHAVWGGFELHTLPTGAPGERSPKVVINQNTIYAPGHLGIWGPIVSL